MHRQIACAPTPPDHGPNVPPWRVKLESFDPWDTRDLLAPWLRHGEGLTESRTGEVVPAELPTSGLPRLLGEP